MPEDLAEQVALARSSLPSNRAHIDAKEVERVVFGVIGYPDLAVRIWTDAHAAAVTAWRECRAQMRRQYGARSPHGGWSVFVLFAALLFGGAAAALASGIRTDPAQTEGLLAVLAGLSAVGDLVVLLAVGRLPWNWAAVRMQIGIAITLGVASAFQLSRPTMSVTPLVIAGGVVACVGLLLVLAVRAVRAEQRLEIDTVINVAVERMQPAVDARAAEIQAEASAGLSADDDERIVALRTAVIADLAAEGHVVEPVVPEGTPAGGAMISALLADWHPYSTQD